jgi:MOSC domain-containing protein YiiM
MRPSTTSPLAKLLAGPLNAGKLVWIGLRTQRKGPVLTPASANLLAGRGIDGDHYKTSRDGPRQVTLIERESLNAIASYLQKPGVSPDLLRRNLLTSGINLQALKDNRFRIGQVLLEYTGECAPCGRMEINLGAGGYNAVRGRGGITARILEGGTIELNDRIERIQLS